MNLMTFGLSLLDIVIWPAFALVCFFTLKQPLKQLLLRISSLRVGDARVQFDRQLDEVARQVEDAETEVATSSPRHQLLATARTSPAEAILDAFSLVSKAAETRLQNANIAPPRGGNQHFKEMETQLGQHQLIGVPQLKLFRDLRLLRNKVAHADGFSVTLSSARQYIELCLKLLTSLQQNN